MRELFPIGRWAISTLVQFGCFSMRQGIDLGVRYSRISFLCLFRTDRPTYTISISKETTVLHKIKLILSKRNSNNDWDLKDHYLNPGIHGPKPVDLGLSSSVLVLRPEQQLQSGHWTGLGPTNFVNLGTIRRYIDPRLNLRLHRTSLRIYRPSGRSGVWVGTRP